MVEMKTVPKHKDNSPYIYCIDKLPVMIVYVLLLLSLIDFFSLCIFILVNTTKLWWYFLSKNPINNAIKKYLNQDYIICEGTRKLTQLSFDFFSITTRSYVLHEMHIRMSSLWKSDFGNKRKRYHSTLKILS